MKTPVEKLRELVRLVDETPTKKGIQKAASKKMDILVEEILSGA